MSRIKLRGFAGVVVLIGVLCLAIWGGYAIGVSKSRYVHARANLEIALWAEGLLNSGELSKLRKGNDLFVQVAYEDLLDQSFWSSLSNAEKVPNSDSRINEEAALLKECLDRKSSAITSLDDARAFVRTHLGKHRVVSIQMKQP